jgi:hypothetical protein
MKLKTNVKAGFTVDLSVKSSTEFKTSTEVSIKIEA